MIPNQVATVAYSYVARAKDGETPLQVIKPILQLLVAILVIAIGCFAVFANEIVSFILARNSLKLQILWLFYPWQQD